MHCPALTASAPWNGTARAINVTIRIRSMTELILPHLFVSVSRMTGHVTSQAVVFPDLLRCQEIARAAMSFEMRKAVLGTQRAGRIDLHLQCLRTDLAGAEQSIEIPFCLDQP